MLNQIKELFVPFKSFNDGLIGDRNFFVKLLITIDRFGNALTGGKGNHTISARVGAFVINGVFVSPGTLSIVYRYWEMLENIIDWAFYPIDGLNHCYDAYQKESANRNYSYYSQGSVKLMFLLSILVIIACFFISAVVRTFVLLRPTEKHPHSKEIKLWRVAVLWIICFFLYPLVFTWEFFYNVIKFAFGSF